MKTTNCHGLTWDSHKNSEGDSLYYEPLPEFLTDSVSMQKEILVIGIKKKWLQNFLPQHKIRDLGDKEYPALETLKISLR